jgi:hypothetical protein
VFADAPVELKAMTCESPSSERKRFLPFSLNKHNDDVPVGRINMLTMQAWNSRTLANC